MSQLKQLLQLGEQQNYDRINATLSGLKSEVDIYKERLSVAAKQLACPHDSITDLGSIPLCEECGRKIILRTDLI